ncbi:coronatine-insensitive protein 1-like protein [Tanacetum coccineum]
MEEHPHESIDTVFNCVIPYIHNGDDRNTISLVCRKWYEIDCMTRKHVGVYVVYSRRPSHVVYSRLPSRVAQRFPYLKSLTLKGLPHIRRVILRDSDLEQIARRSTWYCNDLRTLCLEDNQENQNNRKWLHELALNNTRIEYLKMEGDQYAGLKFPPNMRISINNIDQIVLPFVTHVSNNTTYDSTTNVAANDLDNAPEVCDPEDNGGSRSGLEGEVANEPGHKPVFPGDMSPGIVFPGDMSPGKRRRGKLEGDSFLDNFPLRHQEAHTDPPNFQSTNLVPRWTLFPGDMSSRYWDILSSLLMAFVIMSICLLVASFKLIDIGSVIASRHKDIEDVLAPSRQNPTNTGNVPALLAPANHGHDLIIGVEGSKCPGSLTAYDRALCPVSSILSTPGHVLGIRPKPDLLIPIFHRDVRGTSGSNSFHVVSLVIGVLNLIIPLQQRLVVRVDLANMLIDALLDFWPKLGLHVGLQVKLGLQS